MADIWDELALLQGSPLTAASEPVAPAIPAAEPTSYSARQFGFDIPAAAATAGAGLLDVLSLPVTAAARGLGASPEEARYFALSKELAKAKTDLAQQLDVRPDTLPQEAMSFFAPSPFSKAKAVSQLGTNLLSYLGFKGAQAADPESPTTQLIASLAAPLTPAAIRGVGRAGQTLGQSAGVVLGREQALQRAANEAVLQSLGPQGLVNVTEAVAPAATYGAGGLPLTLAEVAQSPSAALRQAAIQQTPEGAVGLTPAIEARKEAIATALGDIGVTPQTGEFPLLLQNAAAEAAAKKGTVESTLLKSLGYEPTTTNLESGTVVQQNIIKRSDEAYEPVKQLWKDVKGKTSIDIAPQLTDALKTFKSFGRLTKKRISTEAKDTIRTAREILLKDDGLTNVDNYQDLRASANAALKNATNTTDKAEISLMRQFKDALDNIDESAIIKGGDPSQVSALTDAIKATKQYYDVFGRGIVKDIIKEKGGELSLKASKVVNKALQSPENVQEIIGKFGASSDEALTLRSEFLGRLAEAGNPTDFLGKHQDVARRIFKNDYSSVAKYAQSVGQKSPLENYANITDSMIPKNIFSNVRETDAFVKEFKNTLAHDFAKSRFLTSQILKRGVNPVDNLNQNRAIAKKLFGDEYGSVEALLKDKAISESPTKLATLATKTQSWTSQMRTAYGAVMSARGVIGLLKRGTIPGGISGTALGYAVAGPAGGAAASLLGSIAGYKLERLGALRESQLNALEAQLFANPRLLKLASSAPTKENVSSLMDTIADLTVSGGKAGANISTSEAPSEKSNVWDELAALE